VKRFIEWLEADKKRTRKVLALFTAATWLLAIVCSYGMLVWGFSTIEILSLVTAQFAAVIGFYMVSNAESD